MAEVQARLRSSRQTLWLPNADDPSMGPMEPAAHEHYRVGETWVTET